MSRVRASLNWDQAQSGEIVSSEGVCSEWRKNGDNGDIACDSYHRYKEDAALMRRLNLNVRFQPGEPIKSIPYVVFYIPFLWDPQDYLRYRQLTGKPFGPL